MLNKIVAELDKILTVLLVVGLVFLIVKNIDVDINLIDGGKSVDCEVVDQSKT